MTRKQAVMWMQGGSAILIVFGLGFALGAHPDLNGSPVLFIDILIWPYDGVQTGEASEFQLTSAMAGGVGHA